MALELRLITSINETDELAWDACANGHPFVQHAFLKTLETSGALGSHRGVLPSHALLIDSSLGLVACAPGMLKWGNKREFGPEIQWLNAGTQAGCFEWPKFQLGVPFFPVMGPRLLVRSDLPCEPLRTALLRSLLYIGQHLQGASVFNMMHIDDASMRYCQSQEGLVSAEWHSMWFNAGYTDFENYVAQLPERKRYKLRKERRQAKSHSLQYKVLTGMDFTDEVLTDYYEGHRRVCESHGGQPWLPQATFSAMARLFRKSALLFGYFDGNALIAGVMGIQSEKERTLFLLQWSQMLPLQSVAFDLICYRPIEYGLQAGLQTINSGLAADHKRLRGWESQPVYNAHWFHNDALKLLAQEKLHL